MRRTGSSGEETIRDEERPRAMNVRGGGEPFARIQSILDVRSARSGRYARFNEAEPLRREGAWRK